MPEVRTPSSSRQASRHVADGLERALEARQPIQDVMAESMEYIKHMQILRQLEQRANEFLVDTKVRTSLELSKKIKLTCSWDR
jgi:hypothetical protein